MTKFEFEAIGTTWSIDIEDNLSETLKVVLLNNIMERIKVFDKTYSRFRKDSLITQMSEKSGEFVLQTDGEKMITLYKKFYDVTNGLVTPLIGQVLVDAGYDDKYSLVGKSLTKPKNWDEVLTWDDPKLTLSEPALLDFGAGGKGYLVDIVSEIIESKNIKSYCVDAGGDMRYRSEVGQELKVGLENPSDTTEVIGVTRVSNCSLCGSAGNRRKWENFNHIINPETLESPNEIISIWVMAETTILADLLTTALFFVDKDKLKSHFEFEYLLLHKDYSIEKSEGFNGEIFTS